MPEIIVRHKGRDVARVVVGDREVTIGRGEGNDIVIAHPKVSRLHARVVLRADGHHVEDCGSKKGCFIGGERVLDRRLVDGDEIWLEEHALLFREVGIAAMAMVAAPPIHEATATVPEPRSERGLAEQERLTALGTLAAAVAQEIKGPVGMIQSFAELTAGLGDALREEAAALPADAAEALRQIADDVAENAAKIREHARRIDGVVAAMRLYEPRRGAPAPLDLGRILDAAAARARDALLLRDPALRVTVETRVAEDLGPIRGVREDLEQVVQSLVKNACQAAASRSREHPGGPAPAVEVSARALGDRVEIRVRDNGAGLPPSMAGRIFDPFGTRVVSEGLGLELAICHDIVTLRHRGEIRFETAPGQHTEFIVTLPRQEGEEIAHG